METFKENFLKVHLAHYRFTVRAQHLPNKERNGFWKVVAGRNCNCRFRQPTPGKSFDGGRVIR
jgi:hypothetical protein